MPLAPVPNSLGGRKLDPWKESVLRVALENPGAEVVIDDLAGRPCAMPHGVRLLGTLGLVILAKLVGKIVRRCQ